MFLFFVIIFIFCYYAYHQHLLFFCASLFDELYGASLTSFYGYFVLIIVFLMSLSVHCLDELYGVLLTFMVICLCTFLWAN